MQTTATQGHAMIAMPAVAPVAAGSHLFKTIHRMLADVVIKKMQEAVGSTGNTAMHKASSSMPAASLDQTNQAFHAGRLASSRTSAQISRNIMSQT
jgi:hypothetical protein